MTITKTITVTAPGKKSVSYTFKDVYSVKTPANNGKEIVLWNDDDKKGYTIDAGKDYDRCVEFLDNVRDANLPVEKRNSGDHDGVINTDDLMAFANGKRKIPGYGCQDVVECSIYKKENNEITFEIIF